MVLISKNKINEKFNTVLITNDEMMSEDEFYEGMLNYLDTCLQEIEESSQEGE